MINAVAILVLAIFVLVALFRKSPRLSVLTMILLIIALLIREAGIIVKAHQIINDVPLRGNLLRQFRGDITAILRYYYWTDLFAIPAYIILVVLCVLGCRDSMSR
jgi:hypothetical protein